LPVIGHNGVSVDIAYQAANSAETITRISCSKQNVAREKNTDAQR